MPIPTAFLTVTSFPYTRVVTQAEFNAGTFGNVANEVWFKHVGTAGVIGQFASAGGTFTPVLKAYESDALTLQRNLTNRTFWLEETNGVNYWFQITRSGGGASNFDFTVNFEFGSLNPTIAAGYVVINDDEDGFPATIFSLDGIFRGFKSAIPGGEIGDTLPSGVSLFHDRYGMYGNPLALFDANLNLVASLDTVPTTGAGSTEASFPVMGSNGARFYVATQSSGAIHSISSSGSVSGVIATLTMPVRALGISRDGTIAYFAGGASLSVDNQSIHRHNLTTDTPMSDLYSVPEFVSGDAGLLAQTRINEHPGEILVLNDGTLVTYYQNTTQTKSVLLHLSAAGALLHTYTYTWPQGIDHIAWATDNPDGINIWFFEDNLARTGSFHHLALATGSLTAGFSSELFSAAHNTSQGTSQIFGPSSSCIMVTSKHGSSSSVITDDGGDSTGSDGGSDTIPTCCDEGGPPGGGDTGVNPDPVGTLPPWMASCTGGGLVDGVADLADGESWL